MFSSFLENAQMMDAATMFQNLQFLGSVYDFRALLVGFLALFLLDLVLKLIAMWRAARMDKWIWFIILFLTSSLGILPLFFLSLTRRQYRTASQAKTA